MVYCDRHAKKPGGRSEHTGGPSHAFFARCEAGGCRVAGMLDTRCGLPTHVTPTLLALCSRTCAQRGYLRVLARF